MGYTLLVQHIGLQGRCFTHFHYYYYSRVPDVLGEVLPDVWPKVFETDITKTHKKPKASNHRCEVYARNDSSTCTHFMEVRRGSDSWIRRGRKQALSVGALG